MNVVELSNIISVIQIYLRSSSLGVTNDVVFHYFATSFGRRKSILNTNRSLTTKN